ncbi:MAG: ribose-5-phosphate isomerase RpiA [Nitrososphaerota archaeon]
MNLNEIEKARKVAIMEALKEIENGYIIGLGSGSTMKIFIQELSKYLKKEKMKIIAVPSSYQSMQIAIENDIPIKNYLDKKELDLTIDSADQVDINKNAIKGGGAAHTREKILFAASKKTIIIIDEEKIIEKLNKPIPLEVFPFSLNYVIKKIEDLGGKANIRIGNGKVGPIISDNGFIIVDANFGEINNPKKLNDELNSIHGIIEHGLFINSMISKVYIGYKNGEVKII